MHTQARERDQQLAAARRVATEKAKSASLRGKKNIGFQTEDESCVCGPACPSDSRLHASCTLSQSSSTDGVGMCVHAYLYIHMYEYIFGGALGNNFCLR